MNRQDNIGICVELKEENEKEIPKKERERERNWQINYNVIIGSISL